jgi:hypothetical protein
LQPYSHQKGKPIQISSVSASMNTESRADTNDPLVQKLKYKVNIDTINDEILNIVFFFVYLAS